MEVEDFLVNALVSLLHDTIFGLVNQSVDALLAAVFDVDGFALFQEFVGSMV